jgi:hypothetical protein
VVRPGYGGEWQMNRGIFYRLMDGAIVRDEALGVNSVAHEFRFAESIPAR